MGHVKEYVILTDTIKDTVWQALTSSTPDPDSIALNLAVLDRVEPTNEMIVFLGTIVATGLTTVEQLKSYKQLYKMVRILRNIEAFFPDNITAFLKAVAEDDHSLHKLGPFVVGDIKRLVEYKTSLLMKDYSTYVDNESPTIS